MSGVLDLEFREVGRDCMWQRGFQVSRYDQRLNLRKSAVYKSKWNEKLELDSRDLSHNWKIQDLLKLC